MELEQWKYPLGFKRLINFMNRAEEYSTQILQKIPGVAIKDFLDLSTEGNHFLLHSCLTFLILSFPISPYWALTSLVFAILKEFIFDGLWKWDSAHDKSNLIFRCSGSLCPFITLLWK